MILWVHSSYTTGKTTGYVILCVYHSSRGKLSVWTIVWHYEMSYKEITCRHTHRDTRVLNQADTWRCWACFRQISSVVASLCSCLLLLSQKEEAEWKAGWKREKETRCRLWVASLFDMESWNQDDDGRAARKGLKLQRKHAVSFPALEANCLANFKGGINVVVKTRYFQSPCRVLDSCKHFSPQSQY